MLWMRQDAIRFWQKNWALEHLDIKSDWVFFLDADEAILPELRDELCAIASKPTKEVSQSAFNINRYFIFLGKRIRHCGYYPSWNVRFFKRGKARYEELNEGHHDHLIDIKSGEIIEFVDDEIEKLQKKVAEKYGYKLVDHKLELYGVKKKS